jgi:hypothetical protein
MEGLFSNFFEVLLCRASFGHYSGRKSTIEGIQGVDVHSQRCLYSSLLELPSSARVLPISQTPGTMAVRVSGPVWQPNRKGIALISAS